MKRWRSIMWPTVGTAGGVAVAMVITHVGGVWGAFAVLAALFVIALIWGLP